MNPIVLDMYHFGHFTVAEAVGRLPSGPLRQAVVNGLGTLAYLVSGSKRGRIERNIRRAFGSGLDDETARNMTIACFRGFWQEMVDWVSHPDSPLEEVPVAGLDHLRQTLDRGRGAILWESNGFGRRVRSKQVLHAHGVRICQTHGATHLGVMETTPEPGSWLRRRVMRAAYERRERRFVDEILIIPVHSTMSAARIYVERLKSNAVLCMTGDGQIARKLYPVRFLGRTVALAPGAVKLSRLTGAPLLPVFWQPEDDGRPVVEIDPPIDPDEVDDEIVNCLQRFADALEKRVMRWPEAYRNWHLLNDVGGSADDVSSSGKAMRARHGTGP